MIRFYKTAAKILRTLKSYLTGAVLNIVLFSYNLLLRYVQSVRRLNKNSSLHCKPERVEVVSCTLTQRQADAIMNSGITTEKYIEILSEFTLRQELRFVQPKLCREHCMRLLKNHHRKV